MYPPTTGVRIAMTDLSLSPALMASIVNDAYLFTVVLRPDFSMAFVSNGIESRLGIDPAEINGSSVTEFVHPEDLERALLHLSGYERFGAPGGTGTFRLRHRDGSWVGFDVTAALVKSEDEEFFAVYCTPVDYQEATNEVLTRLLSGANRRHALEPVLDVISWQENDASVAICWTELDGERVAVSTDLPDTLNGVVSIHGDPWEKARSSTRPVLSADQGDLTQQQRATAADFRRGGVWVVPVHSPSYPEPALITVWTRAGGPRPDAHSYGTEIAARYVELILRWTNQADLLTHAASRDPLTGLANRRELFEQLETTSSHGALLFCDLDHFKPVNDTYGHQGGDIVLKEISRRIEASVRSSDLVARTGGDEFVVVAPDIDLETAAALAQRIRTEIAQPIDIGGASVQVGVTIGVAYAEDILSEAALSGADQALTNAKARDRGTVRWAPGPMPQAHLSASLAIEETQQPPIAQGFPGRSAGSVL